MGQDYPRDLIGYGAHPPHAAWPGSARVAVQFVINYEEGGESSILHGDAASEAFLSEIVGATPYPNSRNMNMESMYEYGSIIKTSKKASSASISKLRLKFMHALPARVRWVGISAGAARTATVWPPRSAISSTTPTHTLTTCPTGTWLTASRS